MRKQILFSVVLLCCTLPAIAAFAHQDHSFTYTATAGMFEDTYDYFKYSPAYMPGFQKNTFWGQLSNLFNQNEYVFYPSDANYYLVGGQFDTMGVGRAGIMFDWSGYEDPLLSTNYAGVENRGYGENTQVNYTDRDSDGRFDLRTELYGQSEAIDKNYTNDLYAAYGIGGFAGLDLGLAVRGMWDSNEQSYNAYNARGSNYGSFKWIGRERQTDIITGREIYTRDEQGTGSFTYGMNEWRAILGGRAKGIMPNLDAVVNLSPVLRNGSNDYEWNHTYAYNNQPSNASIISDFTRTYQEKGFEPGAGEYNLPTSGFGAAADVRVDYQFNPGILFTGWVNYSTLSWKTQDAKKEDSIVTRQRDTVWDTTALQNVLQQTNITETEVLNYDGKGSESVLGAKLRAQFPANGWRLGLGVNLQTSDQRTDSMTVSDDYSATTRFVTGANDPARDYTETYIRSLKYTEKETTVTDTFEFPVGIVIDLLKNVSLQLGAKHVIERTVETTSADDLQFQPDTVIRTYDDGSTTTTPSDYEEYVPRQNSILTMSHNTQYYYGMTWWPYEQLQIDFTGFNYVTSLANYRVSVNIYF